MAKKYYYGNEISFYGMEHGYVDYLTLSKAFDNVHNDEMIKHGLWEQIGGVLGDDDEIFQYYIISPQGADILMEDTNEVVFYNEDYDMYLWGVTHFGTAWDYVLTDIAINW